jgi:hypothetical protein
MENAQTVSDLIKAAGGPATIQAELDRVGSALTRDAIYKWQKTGIPDRYWFVMISLAGCSPDELYRANCVARGIPQPIPEAAE